MSDILEKLAKILNQAENAGTQEEANVFMEKAESLARTYSVDLAKARHITKNKQKTVPVQRSVKIGLRGNRGRKTLVNLFLGIAQANDLKCLIAHDDTVVYAIGFAEDIDISEALYASLVIQQAKFADEYRAEGSWKQERIETGRSLWDDDYEGKPVTWITARLNFQQGFANRIRGRLHEAKRAAEERLQAEEFQRELDHQMKPHLDGANNFTAHFVVWFSNTEGIDLEDPEDITTLEVAEQLRGSDCEDWLLDIVDDYRQSLAVEEDGDPGMEVVLVEKRREVDDFYRQVPKGRGSYNGGLSSTHSSGSHRAGGAAADRASLGSRTGIGGTRGAIGR